MTNWSVTSTVPMSATRPTSLRPRSSSIRCSARSLGSLSRASAERLVLGVGRPARRRAGDRADGHLAVAHAHQNFGARADEREAAEVEMEQERRRVEAPQRAIERERRQRERRGEALRQHDLEDVAGADVLLRLARPWRDIRARWCSTCGSGWASFFCRERGRMRQRRLERRDRRLEPLDRRLVGLLGRELRLRAAPA